MSFASPFPDVEIPEGTVYDYLFGELTEEECAEIENELLQRLMYRRG